MKFNLKEKIEGNVDYKQAEIEVKKLYGKGFNNLE